MSYNVSDVKTIQNTYTADAVGGTSQAAASNSIYTDKRVEASSEQQVTNTSKIDELLEKLCAEFKNLGLSVAELKNSGILFRITGLNQTQVENADKETYKQIYNSLKAAIEDLSCSKEIDLEKLGKRANDYFLAQKTGWSINGFRKWNAGKKQEQNLFTRLKELTNGYPRIKELLNGYDRVEDVPEETLKKAVDIFFNEIIGNDKSPENIKKQLQTFGRLLINTPDSEKQYFKNILSSLVQENRAPGLEAVLASFDTPENRTEWASSWTVEELKEFNKDVSIDIATKNVAQIVQYQTKDAITRNQQVLHEESKKFLEENKEILEIISKKENKDLTPEEKALLAKKELYTAMKAGELSGTAINEIITKEIKVELLDKMNRDAYELPIYREVIEAVEDFVKNNPDIITMSEDEIVKLLDNATNGNYTKVTSGKAETLNAPYTEKSETANNDNNIGFKNNNLVDTSRVEVLKKEVDSTATAQEKIKVVKIKHETPVEKTESKFVETELKNQAFKGIEGIQTYLKETGETTFNFATEVFKKYNDASTTTQDWAMDYLTRSSFAVQNLFLSKITNSLTGMVAAAKEIDLSKFSLIGMTTTTEKQVEAIQEKRV